MKISLTAAIESPDSVAAFLMPKNIFLFCPKTVITAIPANLQLNKS